MTISDKSLVVVNWIFAGDHGRHHIIATGDKVHLDRYGLIPRQPQVTNSIWYVLLHRPGIKAQVEPMWDAVDDVEIEEHFLTIDEANIGDQGVYICQVMMVTKLLQHSYVPRTKVQLFSASHGMHARAKGLVKVGGSFARRQLQPRLRLRVRLLEEREREAKRVND